MFSRKGTKETNEPTRIRFLKDAAGPDFSAQTGDIMEIPRRTAQGLVSSGAAEFTTEEPRVSIQEPVDYAIAHDPRQARREFAAFRAENQQR